LEQVLEQMKNYMRPHFNARWKKKVGEVVKTRDGGEKKYADFKATMYWM
jgi:hypothetical protein